MEGRFITYFRVSTDKQGRSGLGLAAQKKTVEDYLGRNGHEIVGEYTEIESGSKSDRPELAKAIRDCRLKNARLVVAKLDRLARDLHFITGLQKAGIKFTVAEQPEMNELSVHIFAAMAQHERKLIGQRTKAALAIAKERGVKLGNPCLRKGERIPGGGDTANANKARISKAQAFANEMAGVIADTKKQGASSLRQISAALNENGFRTVRGNEWQPNSVKRIIEKAVVVVQ